MPEWLSEHLWAVFFAVFMVLFWSIDGWRYFVSGKPTLSQKVIALTKEYPLLPLFVGLGAGLVFGHWWW